MGGAGAAKHSDWSPLSGRKVIVWPDHDEPGRRYAGDVAALTRAAAAASVAIVLVPAEWPEGWDLADPLPDGAAPETLAQLLAAAAPWTPAAQPQPSGAPDDEAEIGRLARLSLLAYGRERKVAANRLGCPVSILDKAVAAERGNGSTAPGQGRPLDFPEIELWPETVDGAALLDELARAIRRYVVLDAHVADAVVLWVLGVHAFDVWTIFPRLFVTAPERQCGKSTLLELLSLLVPRAQAADNITAAALFRTIEAARPTLLLDEADTYARDNEDLRGVLDSGHKCSGSVVRIVGDNHEPRRFSTWAPVALAAIGHLPGTVEDRSIIIRLRRRRPDEAIESLRQGRTGALDTPARKAARWVADNAPALAAADPAMPRGLYNRTADNWLALLAIADAAGDAWPERARRAAMTLARDGAEDGETARTMLLADLRELFAGEPSGVLLTSEVLPRLHDREDRPWPEYRHGRPITARQIAALLRPLRISTNQTVRKGADRGKGYRAEDMRDAWSRYLSPSIGDIGDIPQDSSRFYDSSSVTSRPGVTDPIPPRVAESATCHRGTGQGPLWWRDDDDEGYCRDPEEATWTE
jgi:putative DNA primase/helicase